MSEDRHAHEPSAVERRISRSREESRRVGRLPDGSLQRERTAESYLRAGFLPRYMERLREIHQGIERHRRELAAAHAALREQHRGDREGFARAWRACVAAWPFEPLNELIRQHNAWYPIERQLPVDPRTRDYVLIAGRSYRREELTAAWALARFPADGPDAR